MCQSHVNMHLPFRLTLYWPFRRSILNKQEHLVKTRKGTENILNPPKDQRGVQKVQHDQG